MCLSGGRDICLRPHQAHSLYRETTIVHHCGYASFKSVMRLIVIPHYTHLLLIPSNLHRTSTTTHTSHLCPHSSRLHPHVHTHPPAGGHCPFEPRAPFCRFQAACTCHLALEHLPTSPFPRPCVPVPVSPSHCLSRLAQLPIPKCPSKRSPAL